MAHQRFTILPGSTSYGAFLQIRIKTPNPLQWLTDTRDALTFLLEGFRESECPDGDQARAYGVMFFSWLYPLPSQFEAGAKPLDWTPHNTENGGVYLTSDGLAIRFMESATFEVLDAITRAMLSLFCFNQYDSEANTRAAFFGLLGSLMLSSDDLPALVKSGGTDFFGLGNAEKQIALDLAAARMAHGQELRTLQMLRAGARVNSRFYNGLSRLVADGHLSEEALNSLLDYVATGNEEQPQEFAF